MPTPSVDPKVLLLEHEVTPGVDPTPTAATDAIQIMDEVTLPKLAPRYAERNLAKGFFGHDQQLVVGKLMTIGFMMELAGSGAVGTAPPQGKVLECCGMTKNVLAAAVANTAQAGGASTIQLHAGASATNDFYRNLAIRITGGTGAGQEGIVKQYVGATKTATMYEAWDTPPDNTSAFSVDAAASYYPLSAINKTATIYFYYEGQIHKLLYAHGTAGIRLPSGDIPRIPVEMTGLYGGIVDGAMVEVDLDSWTVPVAVNNENTGDIRVLGYEGANMYSLELMLNNQNEYRNIPGAEDILFVDRAPAGSIELETATIADFDYPTKVLTPVLGPIKATQGTASGNKVTVFAPNSQLTEPDHGSQQGVGTKKFNVRAKSSARGNDELIVIFR
jgi:hypothetical protein